MRVNPRNGHRSSSEVPARHGRVEPVPFSEKVSNSLVKIIALEDIKDIPQVYGRVMIGFFFIGLLGVFLYFFISGYQANREERFLSLHSSAGDCKVVLSPVTGEYILDSNGYWQGQVGFEYALGIYSFNFYNFLGSAEDFGQLLLGAYAEILEVSAGSFNNSLALNLMYWMVYSISTSWDGSIQQLQFTGSPSMIFDRRYIASSMSNEFGVCDIRSSTSFDKKNALLTVEYNVIDFVSSDACRNITIPSHLGYVPQFDGETFRIEVDVHALITGAAINMGILSPYELERIPHTTYRVEQAGKWYTIDQYYNPRYPGMQPLHCQRDAELEESGTASEYVCVIRSGTLYMYPTYNHIGANVSYPKYCSCDYMEKRESGICNSFNFIPSLIFYEFESEWSQSEDDLFAFSVLSNYSGHDRNRQVYDAAFDAIVETDMRYNDTWRKDAYQFCKENASQSCSLLTFVVSDFGNTVSDYYYQINHGACNDTFTITEEALNRAVANPPTNVEER